MGTIGSRLLAAIAAVTFLIVVAPEEATGDVSWYAATGCEQAYRIPTSEATCLSASFNNSYNASNMGYYYSVSTQCGDYGTVVVRADRISSGDTMANLTAESSEDSGYANAKHRPFTCCLDQSDLCYKNQVEADSRGRITVVENSNGTVTAGWATVSTHQQRYDFCQDNPNNIYCTNDPSGDANTDPNAECNEDTDPPCNCGDHYCKVEDCTSAYEESQASDSCTNDMFSDHSMSISTTNGSSQDCTMEGQCMARIETVNRDPEPPYQRWVWDDVEITTDVENMDDLRNCGGALTTDASCTDDNQID